MSVTSPCIAVCQLEADSDLCVGCLRTRDEIARWGMLERDGKQAILLAVAARRRAREEGASGEGSKNPR
jgi:uncharacterized protein